MNLHQPLTVVVFGELIIVNKSLLTKYSVVSSKQNDLIFQHLKKNVYL